MRTILKRTPIPNQLCRRERAKANLKSYTTLTPKLHIATYTYIILTPLNYFSTTIRISSLARFVSV